MGNRTGVPRQQTPVRDRRRAHPPATVGGAGGAIHPGRHQPGDHLVHPPRPARSRPRRPPRPRPLVHHQAGRLGRRHAHRAPPRTPDRQVSPTSPRPGPLRPIPRHPAQPPALRRITPKHEFILSLLLLVLVDKWLVTTWWVFGLAAAGPAYVALARYRIQEWRSLHAETREAMLGQINWPWNPTD